MGALGNFILVKEVQTKKHQDKTNHYKALGAQF